MLPGRGPGVYADSLLKVRDGPREAVAIGLPCLARETSLGARDRL